MCLLALLWNLRKTLDITLSVAHFNHQLRPEAAEEAEFVHSLVCKTGHPLCHRHEKCGRARPAQTGRGLEETARELRYAFLERTRHDLAAHRIATAHHAQDNSETLLLHLSGAVGSVDWAATLRCVGTSSDHCSPLSGGKSSLT